MEIEYSLRPAVPDLPDPYADAGAEVTEVGAYPLRIVVGPIE